MLILVTNDDGVHSPGILVLAEQLAVLGEVVAVSQGYVSITPLYLDMTNYHSFAELSAWGFPGGEEAGSWCS